MEKDLAPININRGKARYVVVALVVVLSLCIAWLMSDREPESKEMTLAFIKHYETRYASRPPKDQIEDRLRLVEFTLKKLRCDKIETKRYRCQAAVLINGHSVGDNTGAEDAIYTHDAKGWRFTPLENEPPA